MHYLPILQDSFLCCWAHSKNMRYPFLQLLHTVMVQQMNTKPTIEQEMLHHHLLTRDYGDALMILLYTTYYDLYLVWRSLLDRNNSNHFHLLLWKCLNPYDS